MSDSFAIPTVLVFAPLIAGLLQKLFFRGGGFKHVTDMLYLGLVAAFVLGVLQVDRFTGLTGVPMLLAAGSIVTLLIASVFSWLVPSEDEEELDTKQMRHTRP